MGQIELVAAGAPRDSQNAPADDIGELKTQLLETFRAAPPLPEVEGGLKKVAVRFQALVAHDEYIARRLADLFSPPSIDTDSDGSEGHEGPNLAQCISAVSTAVDEVGNPTKAQRKAIEASQTAQNFLPTSAAAVEVAVGLSANLKGPNGKPKYARPASAGKSEAGRTRATEIRAAIVKAWTVQRSGEVNEVAADGLRIRKAHLCARLANQRGEPAAVEKADALEIL